MKKLLLSLLVIAGSNAYAIPDLECSFTYKVSPKTCGDSPICDSVLQQIATFQVKNHENGNKYYTSNAIGEGNLKYAQVGFYKKENFFGQKTDSVSLQIWDANTRNGTTLHNLPVNGLDTIISPMTTTIDKPDHKGFYDLKCKIVAEEASRE